MHTPRTQSGFTLVETLVSVLLLTMTIVLPYYAIQRSLSATFASRDDLIASALAQEALEFVHGVRDNNYLAGKDSDDWMFGIDGGNGEVNCLSPNRCTIDSTRNTVAQAVVQCASGNCATRPLYLSSAIPNFYTHTVTGTQTKYIRYIQLTEVSANEMRVTATVTWFDHGTHTITVTDVLTNWL